jgi:hypothetical protein
VPHPQPSEGAGLDEISPILERRPPVAAIVPQIAGFDPTNPNHDDDYRSCPRVAPRHHSHLDKSLIECILTSVITTSTRAIPKTELPARLNRIKNENQDRPNRLKSRHLFTLVFCPIAKPRIFNRLHTLAEKRGGYTPVISTIDCPIGKYKVELSWLRLRKK